MAINFNNEPYYDDFDENKNYYRTLFKPGNAVQARELTQLQTTLQDQIKKFEDDFNGKPLIETLLTPTRIYVKTFKALKDKIQALAHITGGGIVENLPRVLPEGLRAIIDESSVQVLPIFNLIGQHVERSEMFRAFNMGVGMILVVKPENVDAVLASTDGYIIGHLEKGTKEAILVN